MRPGPGKQGPGCATASTDSLCPRAMPHMPGILTHVRGGRPFKQGCPLIFSFTSPASYLAFHGCKESFMSVVEVPELGPARLLYCCCDRRGPQISARGVQLQQGVRSTVGAPLEAHSHGCCAAKRHCSPAAAAATRDSKTFGRACARAYRQVHGAQIQISHIHQHSTYLRWGAAAGLRHSSVEHPAERMGKVRSRVLYA